MVKLTYLQMAIVAIHTLKTRGGTSRVAIKKYIINRYNGINGNMTTFNKYLANGLNRGVERGILVQSKQSFKLGENGPAAFRQIQRITENIICKRKMARKTIHPNAIAKVSSYNRVNKTTGKKIAVSSYIKNFYLKKN